MNDASNAERRAPDAQNADRVAEGQDLTSLNKLLQWGAANSASTGTAEQSSHSKPMRSPEELKRDRVWLDAAFPDMFGDVKRLSALLAGNIRPEQGEENGSTELSEESRIEILNALEEYMADLNYAVNITKLGTLGPVIENARHESPRVRAAALWVLGTSMQNVDDVKAQVIAAGGIPVIVAGLEDGHAAPRSKAFRAASALLRHADEDTAAEFRAAGGLSPFKAAVIDDDNMVRMKALFTLSHADSVGMPWFTKAVLDDSSIVSQLSVLVSQLDDSDVALVESTLDALEVLACQDRIRLLELAPELLGYLEHRRVSSTDPNLRSRFDAALQCLAHHIPV